MNNDTSILIACDNDEHVASITKLLQQCAEDVPHDRVNNASAARDILRQDNTFTFLFINLNEGVNNDCATLQDIRAEWPDLSLIVMTHSDDKTDVITQALAHGAEDYFDISQLNSLAMSQLLAHANKKRQLRQELVRAKQREFKLATHDLLTGLPNRQLFSQLLKESIAYAKRNNNKVGILIIDLDQFKHINDTLGHRVGDQLLKEIAQRLRACKRESDTLARLGGDEFACIVKDMTNPSDITHVIHSVQEAIAKPFTINDKELYISPSIGVAISPDNGEDDDTLIKHADTAMYSAKNSGRGGFQFFSSEMNDVIKKRLELEMDLRNAMERNEFIVHYQTQVHADGNTIIGAEALVRWNHPKHGMIGPNDFIPLAEETGLILKLGEWVLKTACAQNKAWQEKGLPPIRIAVNFSASQFEQEDLVDIIDNILIECKLAPKWLELEMTESVIMRNVDPTIERLRQLKDLGIRISIDDFGTGYSSLSYLRRFPIDVLKIDQSFIHSLSKHPEDAEIIKAIIAMANSLRIEVIAEGIETKEQQQFLSAANCLNMQGFLFSHPMPPEEFTQALKESNQA